jgi:hypothetical protein
MARGCHLYPNILDTKRDSGLLDGMKNLNKHASLMAYIQSHG